MNRISKITLLTLGVVVFIFLAASLAGGLYMVNFALKPEMESMQAEKERVCGGYPMLCGWVDSLESCGIIRDTSMVDDEGFTIHAYYAAAEGGSRKTAVIVHGYTNSPYSVMMLARMYRDSLGYNVFMPHLNFHGASEGDAIQMGWKDRLDVERWIPVAHGMFNDTLQVVHGVSMGGATTMMVSGDELPEYVRGFVDDCGYTTVWDQFAFRLKEQFGLPPFPILYAADLVTRIRYGWGFREASSLDQLARCGLPMLFIHGAEDDFVPTAHVFRNFDAKVNGYKDLWVVPGTAHARAYKNYPAEYTERVRMFLKDQVE